MSFLFLSRFFPRPSLRANCSNSDDALPAFHKRALCGRVLTSPCAARGCAALVPLLRARALRSFLVSIFHTPPWGRQSPYPCVPVPLCTCRGGGWQCPRDEWPYPGVGGSAPGMLPRPSPLPGGAEGAGPEQMVLQLPPAVPRPRSRALPGDPAPSAAAVSPLRPHRTSCVGRKSRDEASQLPSAESCRGRVSCLGLFFPPSSFSRTPLLPLPQGI